MDLGIPAAVGAIRASLEIARLAVNARDDAKVQTALIDANMKLLDLSTAALALSEKNNALLASLAALQREKDQIESKLEERAQYELCEVVAGSFVYARKAANGDVQPMPYLCQPCYDKGVKTILRAVDRHMFGPAFQCVENDAHTISTGGEASPRQPRFRPLA